MRAKRIFFNIFIFFISGFLFLYAFFLFFLPFILNSSIFKEKVENFVEQKYEIDLNIDNFNIISKSDELVYEVDFIVKDKEQLERIIKELENTSLSQEESTRLEAELNNIIIELAKIK